VATMEGAKWRAPKKAMVGSFAGCCCARAAHTAAASLSTAEFQSLYARFSTRTSSREGHVAFSPSAMVFSRSARDRGVFGRFDPVIAARRALQQVFGSATI